MGIKMNKMQERKSICHAELVCSALPHPSLRSGLSQRDIVHGPASAASCGRSMIEMLGVLAVIGVLSLGGLAGYTMAMNYHRANETMHDVMLRATNVPMKWEDYASKEKNFKFEFNDMGSYKTSNGVGYTVETYSEGPNSASGYAFRVEVSGVPSEVCKRIHNMNPTAVDAIEPAISNCGSATTDMIFYFDEDFKGGPISSSSGAGSSGSGGGLSGGGGCSPECGANYECVDGSCQCKNEEPFCEACETPDVDGNGCYLGTCSNTCTVCESCQNGKCQLKQPNPGCTSPKVAETDVNGCFTGNCLCPESTPTECTGSCEVLEQDAAGCNVCVDKTIQIQSGECCDEGLVSCCPLNGNTCQCNEPECPQVSNSCSSGNCVEVEPTTVCGKQCPGGFVDLNDPNLDCDIISMFTGNHYYKCGEYGDTLRCCCEATAPGWNTCTDGSGHCKLCLAPKVFAAPCDCVCSGNTTECGIDCCSSDEVCSEYNSCCTIIAGCEKYGLTCGCEKCENGYVPNADGTQCVEECNENNTGTSCKTDTGADGLCLRGSCQTKDCVGDEVLQIYYPDAAVNTVYPETSVLGSAALGCCVNNPLTSPSYRIIPENRAYQQLCCPANKPVYHVEEEEKAIPRYACFESQPKITGYRCVDYSSLEKCKETAYTRDWGVMNCSKGEIWVGDVGWWIECE